MNGVCVGGFQMSVGDGDGYWRIADGWQSLGIATVKMSWAEALGDVNSLSGYDIGIFYSWGLRSWLKFQPVMKKTLIVAGVPGADQLHAYFTQLNPPPNVQQCIVVQVNSEPASVQLAKSSGAGSCVLVADGSVIPDLTQPRLNIEANIVEPQTLPFDRHVRIKDSATTFAIAQKMAELLMQGM